uniref:FtsK/SpoIIIE domain-containing protein n=1 Tax=Paraclostridium bifermentans TaxID=1490 RepID=UPI00374E61C7
MIRVDSKIRKELVEKTLKVAKEGAVKPLLFENYMGRVLAERYNNLDPKLKEYPKKILLPKSLDDMLKGDLRPSDDSITISGPLDMDGLPIWFDSSTDKVDIHMGTQNGDSRFPCTEAFSDSTIHMLLAGSTGSGKSVALNDLIYAMCLQYAPWEINLVMSDAKIVEFKAYAKGHQLPHISAIAATGDSDYLISVLRYYYNEMIDMNTVYT